MNRLPFNLLASIILLAIVFVVANFGLPNANASGGQAPGMVVDGVNNGQIQLRGFGFRPGSLVSVELRHRQGDEVATGTNVWVDVHGTFATQFTVAPFTEEIASVSGPNSIQWQDWIVVATTSTGTLIVPLKSLGAQ